MYNHIDPMWVENHRFICLWNHCTLDLGLSVSVMTSIKSTSVVLREQSTKFCNGCHFYNHFYNMNTILSLHFYTSHSVCAIFTKQSITGDNKQARTPQVLVLKCCFLFFFFLLKKMYLPHVLICYQSGDSCVSLSPGKICSIQIFKCNHEPCFSSILP